MGQTRFLSGNFAPHKLHLTTPQWLMISINRLAHKMLSKPKKYPSSLIPPAEVISAAKEKMKSQLAKTIIVGAIVLASVACNSARVNTAPSKQAAGHVATSTEMFMAHFAFNSSVLTARGMDALSSNAIELRKDPSLMVEAQGYCDDRGSVKYNLALGERRAKAAKAYLVKLGIDSNRITTISFGKSNPIDTAEDEIAWATNRRTSFVVQNTVNPLAILK